MDKVKKMVGINLQALRKRRGLTLQELSDLTGVSKSMLGEIERGATSPTITVLWKIADGLRIPVTLLLQEDVPHFTLIREEEMEVFTEGDAYTIASIFPYDPGRKFEIFHIQFNPGSTHESKGHSKGIGEHILVYEGVLTVGVGDRSVELNKGDSLYFQGDDIHVYSNQGSAPTKAYSIISYERGTV